MSTGGTLPRGPVHQILIRDEGLPIHGLHPERERALREQFTDYRLWGRDELAVLLEDEFGARARRAFDRFRPYAYQADLARYCLLHRFGGWYVDYGMRQVRLPAFIPEVDLITFRDRQEHSCTSWAVQIGLMYARPGLSVFAEAVERCVANAERGYYGPTALSPTGPAVLGQALATYGSELRMLLGDFVDLTPTHRRDNLAFVGADGWIWALHKEERAGRLGIDGTNAYNDLWHAGLVYSTEPAAERPGTQLSDAYRQIDPTPPPPRLRTLVAAEARRRAGRLRGR